MVKSFGDRLERGFSIRSTSPRLTTRHGHIGFVFSDDLLRTASPRSLRAMERGFSIRSTSLQLTTRHGHISLVSSDELLRTASPRSLRAMERTRPRVLSSASR
jgi:hypothetical protein